MSSIVFPIALRSGSRVALVVGGGSVALRKACALLAGGFRLRVVAPNVAHALRELAATADVTLCERAYESSDVQGVAVAVAATGDDRVDALVVADARQSGVLVCDASAPDRGDFTMMATLRLGDLTIAVESGGSSPSFSRRMLDEIQARFGDEYAQAARALARIRREIRPLPRAERIALMQRLSALPINELAAAETQRRVICASRSSALATAQARIVAALVAQHGIATEILDVTTAGDRDRERPLHELGEVNVFVKELELALRERRADYAVHSAKDLPSELSGDMTIAAISAREDPRDAFCSERYARFEDLPPGAVVGTSSLRRRFQLEAMRADLVYVDVRGNVDTRLRKLREGQYDAVVLAMAGLRRLAMRATHTVPWPVDEFVPAAGQGALAIEVRAENALLAYEISATVSDSVAERCVRCERAVLRALRAGCSAPIGVHAIAQDERMRVVVVYATSSGLIRAAQEGQASSVPEAEALGEAIARDVMSQIPTAGAHA